MWRKKFDTELLKADATFPQPVAFLTSSAALEYREANPFAL